MERINRYNIRRLGEKIMTEFKYKMVAVPKEFYDDLKKVAKANHRSMSGQVAFWITQAKKGENNEY